MDRRRHITAVDLHRDVSSLEFTELTVEALSKIAERSRVVGGSCWMSANVYGLSPATRIADREAA
jgi:hypothetical protein